MGVPKKVVAHGPILEVGGGIAIDCRFIDRIELASRFVDPGGLRLLLAIEDIEVGLEFPGTRAEAEDLIVAIAPYTRAAPLTNDIDYAEAEDLRDSILEGTYEMPPVVRVDDDPVEVSDGLVSTGMIAWVVDDILDAARQGKLIEMADKSLAPAALFTLAIAASEPPSVEALNDRLQEYRERQRHRNPS